MAEWRPFLYCDFKMIPASQNEKNLLFYELSWDSVSICVSCLLVHYYRPFRWREGVGKKFASVIAIVFLSQLPSWVQRTDLLP